MSDFRPAIHKWLRGPGGRLRRIPGIPPLLPPSSRYQYAQMEGYFLQSEIAIRGAWSVGDKERRMVEIRDLKDAPHARSW